MTLPIDQADILDRTMKNLAFIQREQRAGEDLFEVTQLVNTVLAALAAPWQSNGRFWNCTIVKAEAEGWPRVSSCEGAFTPKTLGELMTEMRNALAHGQVTYSGSEDIDEIESSTRERSKPYPIRWRARLTVTELEQMLGRFVSYAR